MKRMVLGLAAAALTALPNLLLAQATCPSGTSAFQATGQNVQAALTGNMMCLGTVSDPNNRWQEFHRSDGALIDFKLGAGHPIDPTQQVGTWSFNNAASTVTHNYGAGGVFTWLMCRAGPPGNPNPITLVSTGGAGTRTGVTLQNGGPSQCP